MKTYWKHKCWEASGIIFQKFVKPRAIFKMVFEGYGIFDRFLIVLLILKVSGNIKRIFQNL